MKTMELMRDAVDAVLEGLLRQKYAEGLTQGRTEERAWHAAQRDGKDALISHLTARVATLERVLKTMLASAYPHPTEHPTMTEAWKVGREAMDAQPAVSLDRIKAAALRELSNELEASLKPKHYGARRAGYEEGVRDALRSIDDKAERLEEENDNARPTE